MLRGLFIARLARAPNYQTGAGYKTDPKVKALSTSATPGSGPTSPASTRRTRRASVDSKGQTVDDKKLTGDGGRGQQEAKPTPGQPDLSKPQITLPPEVQQLLDTLKLPGTAPSLPQLPGGLPQLPQDVIKQLTDSLGATGATGPVGPDGRCRPTRPSSSTTCSGNETTTRRGTGSIVASPGARGSGHGADRRSSAVFLAYNANNGPAVRAHLRRLGASCPAASNLVEGNEVRVGGFRVGVVDKIVPETTAWRHAQDDRGGPHEARQVGRAAGEGLAR